MRRTLTPQLDTSVGDTLLIFIDLSGGRQRLGGSALAQCFGQFGGPAADLEDPRLLTGFFEAQRELRRRNRLLAYHDRSDGGLIAALVEMAFAGRTGLDVELPAGVDALGYLFNEEPGVVVQIRDRDQAAVQAVLGEHGLSEVAGDCARRSSWRHLRRARRQNALSRVPDAAASMLVGADAPHAALARRSRMCAGSVRAPCKTKRTRA